MRRDALVHPLREQVAVHGQRRAAGHPRLIRRLEHDGAQQAHLRLEEAVRVVRLRALEGVRANELRETIRLVRRRAAYGATLVEDHLVTACRELDGGLRSGQSSTHDVNGCGAHSREYSGWTG